MLTLNRVRKRWGDVVRDRPWGNELVLLKRGPKATVLSFCVCVCPCTEVFLQRHGGRTAGFPQVSAPAKTQAPAAGHGQDRRGHQHAHFQRPQTPGQRDHGLKFFFVVLGKGGGQTVGLF